MPRPYRWTWAKSLHWSGSAERDPRGLRGPGKYESYSGPATDKGPTWAAHSVPPSGRTFRERGTWCWWSRRRRRVEQDGGSDAAWAWRRPRGRRLDGLLALSSRWTWRRTRDRSTFRDIASLRQTAPWRTYIHQSVTLSRSLNYRLARKTGSLAVVSYKGAKWFQKVATRLRCDGI